MKNKKQNNLEKILNNEIKVHPELSLFFNKDNSIKYEYLNLSKPKSISTRNIKNTKKTNLIESLNTFRNIYYDFSNIKNQSLNKIKELENENNLFEKDYNKFSNKNIYDYTELKNEYEKKNYKFPKIRKNENLFDKNMLFFNNSDLNKYIIYGSRNLKQEKRSIDYLKKIKSLVDSMRINDNSNNHITKYNSAPKLNIKKVFHSFKNSHNYKKDIYKIKNTLNNLSDLDNFFEKNNSINNTIIHSYVTRDTSVINSPRINKKSILRLNLLKQEYKKELIKKEETNDNDNEKKNGPIQQFKQLFPSYLNKSLLDISIKNKIYLLYKHPIEKLYDKVSKVQETSTFNNSIKFYLTNRKINIENKITNSSLLKELNQAKKKIFQFDLKKNYEFINQEKKIFKLSKEQSDKIKTDNYLNNQINYYEKKMINNICKK